MHLGPVRPRLGVPIPKVTLTDAPRLGQLLARHCPKLVQLTGDNVFGDGDGKEASSSLIHAIRACRGNQGGGLRSIRVQYFMDNEDLMEDILEHSDTLEELILVNGSTMKSETFQQILSSCPNLVTFAVLGSRHSFVALQCSDVLGESSPWEDDLVEGQEWVCKNLKTLRLRLDRDLDDLWMYESNIDMEDDNDLQGLQESDSEENTATTVEPQVDGPGPKRKGVSLEKLDKAVARKVYAQIGKLSELEELSIQLEHVYLDKYEFLKDLKTTGKKDFMRRI